MQVIILAGGLGTRLKEETLHKPKALVEIGGKPIIWHIMKSYAHYGFNDFIIATGYKNKLIKEYFLKYYYNNCDLDINIKENKVNVIEDNNLENWNVKIVHTGEDTQTGGRLKRLEKYVEDDNFMATYCDGVSNVNLKKLVEYHKKHGKIGTLTAVWPPSRFGALKIDAKETITKFAEKPKGGDGRVNGGFYTFKKDFFDYLKEDSTILEREPLTKLAEEGNLKAFIHEGFWQNMDNLKETEYLNELWNSGKAPWKTW